MSGYCSVVIGKNRQITSNIIPTTFPVLGKNLFELTSFNYTDWSTGGYVLSPNIDVSTGTITLTGAGDGAT